jgi:hypothetical protein
MRLLSLGEDHARAIQSR